MVTLGKSDFLVDILSILTCFSSLPPPNSLTVLVVLTSRLRRSTVVRVQVRVVRLVVVTVACVVGARETPVVVGSTSVGAWKTFVIVNPCVGAWKTCCIVSRTCSGARKMFVIVSSFRVGARKTPVTVGITCVGARKTLVIAGRTRVGARKTSFVVVIVGRTSVGAKKTSFVVVIVVPSWWR